MNITFASIHIKRFRSLMDIKLKFDFDSPLVICGENNIGKTNVLRALNVFFNHLDNQRLYDACVDIPHHVYYGSRGAGANTEIIGEFEINNILKNVKVVFDSNNDIKYFIDDLSCSESEVRQILSEFKYLFVESHNVNLPELISLVLEKDGLLPLDAKRAKQSKPLKKLEEFIKLSQKAIFDIEKSINQYFRGLTDFDGVLKDKTIKINFAEFEKLRDVVATMTSITLFDGNNHGVASKGSGAQRALFLSLLQFISDTSKKKVIWGIDEPEAFLQPKLQKKVFQVFNKIVTEKKQLIIITTHSQHFINLKSLEHTYLFKGKLTPKSYKRKPGESFYEMATDPVVFNSNFEKAKLIKEHLGILNNDGWEVMPYNIIVEGEEDKKYLEMLIDAIELPIPNIIFSGGASKIAGYLQYYNMFAKDIEYKPEFVCVFDNDNEGREQAKKIKSNYNNIVVKVVDLPRLDNASKTTHPKADWEIEDFLPQQLFIDVVNQLLKKEGYKKITLTQINNRTSIAHRDKQILKYIEECSNQNNPTMEPFILDNEGRKKYICIQFCKSVEPEIIKTNLNVNQINFLKSLCK